jgi:hypothetical protein
MSNDGKRLASEPLRTAAQKARDLLDCIADPYSRIWGAGRPSHELLELAASVVIDLDIALDRIG